MTRAPLALLGGTFDPPHIGHLFLAECARKQFGAERVVFLPAGDPYRKSGSTPEAPAAAHVPSPASARIEMVRLAIADNESFSLDTREVNRPGPTYTVDTLEEMHAEGWNDLLLILGEDALDDLPTWKHPDRILELATIAVAPKPWQSPNRDSRVRGPKSEIIAMPPLPISSTLIRQRVADGEPIRYLVPRAVERYIAEAKLYRG